MTLALALLLPALSRVEGTPQTDPISQLRDVNDRIRGNACSTLGEMGHPSAIPHLVRLLARPEPVEAVRIEAVKALERIAGVKTEKGADPASWWTEWVKEEYPKRYPATSYSKEEIRTALQAELDDLNQKAREARGEIRILSSAVAIIAIAFLLVMIYFVGHVSSKLKEWKELVRQAGVYIEESQQITKRTDRVLEELEVKKVEILEFVKKLKEEKEGEIERYSDLLQQNTEHKMREEVMGLRQKAERELQETLGTLKQNVDLDMRRLAGDQKERLDKDLKVQHGLFLKEVDAHTIFLQAAFHHSNGKAEEALRLYRKLVALKPDHQVGWEKMGNALRDLLRFEEAIESYEKAIELNPNDPSPYYNMAATYARQKKRDKMLETLTLAIKNDGEFKDEALNDPAFREYWNDPAFKDLAEA